jgi:DNA-binding response OmpR family regulator
MEMGADDYLTKPFGRLELLNAIETRLKKRLSRPFYSKSLENLDHLVSKKTNGLTELKKLYPSEN